MWVLLHPCLRDLGYGQDDVRLLLRCSFQRRILWQPEVTRASRHNGEHWSGKGTILVSKVAGVCLERSTGMTSSVGSATESVETTSRSAAEMSPSISLALTEAS